jgi:hypothetical protein
MAKRGVAALVTDGVVRDMAGVLGTGLPVWCGGAAAPPSVAGLTFVNWQEPIGCGVGAAPPAAGDLDAKPAVVVCADGLAGGRRDFDPRRLAHPRRPPRAPLAIQGGWEGPARTQSPTRIPRTALFS